MKLIEAIEYLLDNGYKIIESANFTRHDLARLGKHSAAVKRSNIEARREDTDAEYQDDKRYKDYDGVKWLTIKKRDAETLLSAYVDGIFDSLIDYDKEHEALDSEQKQELDELLKEYNDKSNGYEDYYNIMLELQRFQANDIGDIEQIFKDAMVFWKKYMHGHVTVYRGVAFSEEEYKKISAGIDVRRISSILAKINNRTKQFNSFSVSPYTALGFTEDYTVQDGKTVRKPYSAIIAAEVEPNDINFAFTAYLVGRHHSIGEYELNINNLKDLTNLRVITDIDNILKRLETSLTQEKLQAKLDKLQDYTLLFNRVHKIMDAITNKIYIIGDILGYHVLYDDDTKKILSSAIKPDMRITVYGDYYCALALRAKKCDIYSIKDNKLITSIPGVFINTSLLDYNILKISLADKNNCQIWFDIKSGKSLFNNIAVRSALNYNTSETRLPSDTWMLIRLNNGKSTVFDLVTHKIVFKNNKMFDDITVDGKYLICVNGYEKETYIPAGKILLKIK